MKVLFSWLKSYLDNDISFAEFQKNVTRLGFGIDSVEKIGIETENVFTAQIIKIEKHPNADRLSLCEVSTGKDIYKVVCGAKNIYEGQKVPLALVGAKLPEGTLKKAKIRGIESNGMICSAIELGLKGYDSSGILELDKNVPLGLDLKKIFPQSDYIFELEITPNLGYCLSHFSLARELSIFYGYRLKEIQIPDYNSEGKKEVDIKIENSENCPRYCAFIVKNVKNKKTPDYIYERLKAIGLNPKGDILIDASNYVMFELGQPTHCFDLRNIEGGEVWVRQARDGEMIKTLDGQEQKLNSEVMIIADAKKPIAIAGVMGGFYSSINNDTSDILIESAIFKPSNVRKSSRILKLKSDSSFRFERGVDPQMQLKAAARIVQIIKEVNPEIEISQIEDNQSLKSKAVNIEINYDKINSILGTNLEKKEIDKCLLSLSPLYDGKIFPVPSYRYDLKNIWDISEEVARYIGYEVIESKTSMPVFKVEDNPLNEIIKYFLDNSKKYGFSEVCNYDLVSLKEIKNILYNESECLTLKNPLSLDFNYLRPSIIISLIKNLKYNLNRGRNSVLICEYGKVFKYKKEKIVEENNFAGIIYGNVRDEFWKGEKENFDFYHLKGIVSSLFSCYESFKFDKLGEYPPYFDKEVCLSLKIGDVLVGYCGLVNPIIVKNYDLKDENIFYFEIYIDSVLKFFNNDFYKRITKIKNISPFQQSWRDLSIIVDKKYNWGEIYSEIKDIPEILWIKLIDVYTGKNIGDNFKSFTIRFMFSSMSKTFTDNELNSFIERAFLKLQKKFNAKLRS